MLKLFQDIFNRKNLLQESLEDSWTMLQIDKEMFDASVSSLRQHDSADVEIDIYSTDRRINELEQSVRKKVLTHLAVSGPTDLSIGLTLVSVISDIERIGDYTKNIYDLARERPQRLLAGDWEETIKQLESKISVCLDVIPAALQESDSTKANSIIEDMTGIKKHCDSFVHKLISGEDQHFEAKEAVALVLYIRYLKRIAGHLQNVTSAIVNPFHMLKYKEEKTEED